MFVPSSVGTPKRTRVVLNDQWGVCIRHERLLLLTKDGSCRPNALLYGMPTRLRMGAEPKPTGSRVESASDAHAIQRNGVHGQPTAGSAVVHVAERGTLRRDADASASRSGLRLDYRTRVDLRRFQLRLQILLEDLVATPLTWYNTLRNRRAEYAQLPRSAPPEPEPDCRACHGLGFETCRHCRGLGHRYFWGSSRRQEYDRMFRSGEARHWRTMLYGLFHVERCEVRCRHCRGFGWVSCRVCHGHKLPKEWEHMYL